jgi:hypothetical protein
MHGSALFEILAGAGIKIVYASGSAGPLDVFDIVARARGISDIHSQGTPRQVAKLVASTFLGRLKFVPVIFSGVLSTRGSKSQTTPFYAFLNECGFLRPFTYVEGTRTAYGYSTVDWQFLFLRTNFVDVGNLGECTIIQLDSSIKRSKQTIRSIRSALAKFAENVPNQQGRTKSGTVSAAPPSKVTETNKPVLDERSFSDEPVDLGRVHGLRFTSFQDLGACLL